MHRGLLPLLLAVLPIFSEQPLSADDQAVSKETMALEKLFVDAIERAEPSVVCILVTRNANAALGEPETVPESFGSGVVVGEREQRGLILTNYHVVREAARLFVRLSGGKGSAADVFAADPRSDLAVLRLHDPVPVKRLEMGDGDGVRKGQIVLSIANPFAAGFQDGSASASWGIISNIRRRAPGKTASREQDLSKLTIHHFGTLLQIDARLNLGCSGGALIDLKGKLIGLTTAQAALAGGETAGGFAVPMNARIKEIVGKLMQGQEVEYGFLGVRFDRVSSRRVGGDGVHVSQVIPGSPAYHARLRPPATILAINGVPVHDNDDLFLNIGTLLAGSKADLQLQGYARPITVTLAKYYVPGPIIASNRPSPVHGIRVDYTSVLMQKTNTSGEIPTGVYVSEVQPGSPADVARLQDAVITHVNGAPVETPADFYREAAKRPGPIELTVANRTEKVKLE
jgi:S1-C subfamily serine protease